MKRASINDFRLHDLHHTWASWHEQSGTPLNILQELSGWNTYEMVLRYAHLTPEHLPGYAANISDTPGYIFGRTKPIGTKKAVQHIL